jgi:DNA-binding MarR family transcriptional regulator
MGQKGFSSFLSNHGHVLVCVARDPDIRLRDLAEKIGITERAANKIVSELVAEGYIERKRVGRRNHYRIHSELPMRHRLHRQHEIGDLVSALLR